MNDIKDIFKDTKDKDTEEHFLTIGQAQKYTGISFQTLRKYADEGKIMCFKTPSGQRRFNKQDLEKFTNSPRVIEIQPESQKQNFIYARVSSRKQMDDLSRQLKYIQSNKPEYSTYTTISDIASGINFNRKGLKTILDSCLQNTIGEVVIAHRDRLCRFGFELVRIIVQKAGGTIIVLDDERNKSTEQELAEDLLSIVHIYSCKQMGKRSYKIKQSQKSQIIKDKTETILEPEEDY